MTYISIMNTLYLTTNSTYYTYNTLFNSHNIYQFYTNNSFGTFNEKFKSVYNLTDYQDHNLPVLLYNVDINTVNNHNCKKYVLVEKKNYNGLLNTNSVNPNVLYFIINNNNSTHVSYDNLFSLSTDTIINNGRFVYDIQKVLKYNTDILNITEKSNIVELNINNNFTINIYTYDENIYTKIEDIYNNLNNIELTKTSITNNKIVVNCKYSNENYELFSNNFYTKYSVDFDNLIMSSDFTHSESDPNKTTVYEKYMYLVKGVTYCVEIYTEDENNPDIIYSLRYGENVDILRCCFLLCQSNNRRYFRVDKTDHYWVVIMAISDNTKKNSKGVVNIANYKYLNDVCDTVYGYSNNYYNYSLLENLLNKYYISCTHTSVYQVDVNNKICIIDDGIHIHKNIMHLLPYYLQKYSKSNVDFSINGKRFIIYNKSNNSVKPLVNTPTNVEDKKGNISKIILSNYKPIIKKLTFIIGIITLNRFLYFKKMVESLLPTLNTSEINYHIVIADGNYCEPNLTLYDDYYRELKHRLQYVNFVVIRNSIKYVYIQSNAILKYSSYVDYDCGFILNDDILFMKKGWDNAYYGYPHLCYSLDNKNTIKIDPIFKTNGSVLKSNGVLLTFTKDVVNNIGYFDETNFRIRGHSHIDYSYRCCKLGYNQTDTFLDIDGSNEYIVLMKDNYLDSITKEKRYDKDLYFANMYECERRINLITSENNPIYKDTIIDDQYSTIITNKLHIDFLDKTKSNIFHEYGIYQLHVSTGLSHFKERFKQLYSMADYSNVNYPCLFFGLYGENDLKILESHLGPIYIMWGGTDANQKYRYYWKVMEHIGKLKIVKHFAISQDIYNRLINFGQIDKQFIKLIDFSLVKEELFRPVKTLGTKIFIYNGIKPNNEHVYGVDTYTEVVKRLLQYEYIYSNRLNTPYENVENIYKECFIGLRLTSHDGNANMVTEFKCMGIPVIHNQSEYGLKWKTVDDIVNYIQRYTIVTMNSYKIDFYNGNLDNSILDIGYRNIELMTKYLYKFKNILFICGDYPGYGGAATNCYNIQEFLSNYYTNNYHKDNYHKDNYHKDNYHNTYTVYYNFNGDPNKKYCNCNKCIIIDENDMYKTLKGLTFKPDLIILKNYVSIDLKSIFLSTPIYYFIAGIYLNSLNKYYYTMEKKEDSDKFINWNVIRQIGVADCSFCNSSHTQEILKKFYNLDTQLFYTGLTPFYKKQIVDDPDFMNREYEYGIIISNFNRIIKNVPNIIKILHNNSKNDKIIFIGLNSDKYKIGNNCSNLGLMDTDKVSDYYKKIKYIVQSSYYESCSNVKLEGLFHGCKIVNQ